MTDYQKQNKCILEKKLTSIIKQICTAVKIGFADWNIDKILSEAVKKSPLFNQCKALCKQYDLCYDVATNLSVNVEPGYTRFYNLNNQNKIKTKSKKK